MEILTSELASRFFRPAIRPRSFPVSRQTSHATWPGDPPQTEAAFADVWHEWIKAIEVNSELYFVPRLREGSRCLGIVGIHDVHSKTPELGIWLRADFHGQGLGHELVGAVAGWRSEHVPLDYFEYPVAENNIASRRIAEAYGGKIPSYRANAKYRSVVYHMPPVQLPGFCRDTELAH